VPQLVEPAEAPHLARDTQAHAVGFRRLDAHAGLHVVLLRDVLAVAREPLVGIQTVRPHDRLPPLAVTPPEPGQRAGAAEPRAVVPVFKLPAAADRGQARIAAAGICRLPLAGCANLETHVVHARCHAMIVAAPRHGHVQTVAVTHAVQQPYGGRQSRGIEGDREAASVGQTHTHAGMRGVQSKRVPPRIPQHGTALRQTVDRTGNPLHRHSRMAHAERALKTALRRIGIPGARLVERDHQ